MTPVNAEGKYSAYLRVAVEAAQAAGDVIEKAFNAEKNVVCKANDVDLVTETDQACEKLVLGKISEAFPDHKFIGEEGSAAQGFTAGLTDEPTWLVDPLDGTTNFVHRFPFSCVSIGLAINKVVVVGVVYNPMLKEMFTATRGGGAFLNGKKISVSTETHVGKVLMGTEIGTTRDPETVEAVQHRFTTLMTNTRSMRCCGACAMGMVGVAMGRLDAFYEIGFGGVWDVAGASVIVEEAGGKVLDPQGAPFDLMSRRVLVGNPHVAPKIAELLAGSKVSSKEPQLAI